MTTIPALFKQAVEQYDQQPALKEPEDTTNGMRVLTYTELYQYVQTISGYFQHLQLQKDERILLWSPSCINWLATYLGAVQLGIIVVPVDINCQEDFIHRLAQITGARYLATTYKQYESLHNAPLPLIDIDHFPNNYTVATLPIINNDDLAEIVFTSGTTGQPKGVMLSHNNVVSNAEDALSLVQVGSRDCILSILPLSHMFELTIEIALLRVGACIMYARTIVPTKLFHLLETQIITAMVVVPQILQLFMHAVEREVRRKRQKRRWIIAQKIARYLPFSWRRLLFQPVHQRLGKHFRFFVCGGAYLPPEIGRFWENMGVRVIQGYGTTECGPIISGNRMNDHKIESVGQPLPNVEVNIACDHEILVRGPNVAQGYWGNPGLTDASFQDGWYHTGDLGYFDKQRRLYIKGRKTNMIVLANGINVYPEDIEHVLNKQPAIKEAIVLGLDDERLNPQIHAVLLIEEGKEEQASRIVQVTNKQLAPYQQIRAFTIWPDPDFPRSHTLKVKRQDLLNRLEFLRLTKNKQ